MTATTTETARARSLDAVGEPLLEVDDLRVQFRTGAGLVQAVNGVSFTVAAGETLALVGESGSGKGVTGMSLLGLLPRPAAETSGAVRWKGQDLVDAPEPQLRKVRGGEISMIFQDAMTALNPVMTVGKQITEMIGLHLGLKGRAARDRAVEVLQAVGIPQAARRYSSYPHEFSGGMRQRAMIAMAISCDPQLIIADEPTTALDVTVQAQVLEVLAEIQERTGAGMILITHDLGVVAGVADRVMVMYAGRQVETAPTDEVFYDTRHPYTLGLLASLPRVDVDGLMTDDTGGHRLKPIEGQPPSLLALPTGCAFHPRCELAGLPSPCSTDLPELLEITPGHRSACHYATDLAGRASAAGSDYVELVEGEAVDPASSPPSVAGSDDVGVVEGGGVDPASSPPSVAGSDDVGVVEGGEVDPASSPPSPSGPQPSPGSLSSSPTPDPTGAASPRPAAPALASADEVSAGVAEPAEPLSTDLSPGGPLSNGSSAPGTNEEEAP